MWGSSGPVPLSWGITPVRWPSPTVRARADFWQWCASPCLFTTRSGSGSMWMLRHPLFVSINPAHTTVRRSFTQFPSTTLFWMSDLLPVGILKDAGRCFSFCGSRIVSQVRVISIKGGRRASYTRLKKNFFPEIPAYLAITGETYKLPGAMQPKSVRPSKK